MSIPDDTTIRSAVPFEQHEPDSSYVPLATSPWSPWTASSLSTACNSWDIPLQPPPNMWPTSSAPVSKQQSSLGPVPSNWYDDSSAPALQPPVLLEKPSRLDLPFSSNQARHHPYRSKSISRPTASTFISPASWASDHQSTIARSQHSSTSDGLLPTTFSNSYFQPSSDPKLRAGTTSKKDDFAPNHYNDRRTLPPLMRAIDRRPSQPLVNDSSPSSFPSTNEMPFGASRLNYGLSGSSLGRTTPQPQSLTPSLYTTPRSPTSTHSTVIPLQPQFQPSAGPPSSSTPQTVSVSSSAFTPMQYVRILQTWLQLATRVFTEGVVSNSTGGEPIPPVLGSIVTSRPIPNSTNQENAVYLNMEYSERPRAAEI